jgi:hypothetical protein
MPKSVACIIIVAALGLPTGVGKLGRSISFLFIWSVFKGLGSSLLKYFVSYKKVLTVERFPTISPWAMELWRAMTKSMSSVPTLVGS